jgi:hypothetical protein
MISQIKKGCLSFTVSLQEGFRYFKASLWGLGKNITARDENEAAQADLQTSQMQVQATDEAEHSKIKLDTN